jgi:site-specific DNA recombinase
VTAMAQKTTTGARRESAPPIPAVSYVRVSSDEQGERYGPDVQRRAIADYAERAGLDLVAEFADIGVSGTTPLEERPGLSAAFEAVGEGRAEVLVCSTFSRLARDTLTALLAERAFKDAGAEVVFAEGINGDGDAVEMMREMMHSFAGFERKQLVRRLREARQAKADQGGFAVGPAPYGYRSVRGELEPEPETAEVVRRIFADVTRGVTPGKVARALNAEGVPSPLTTRAKTPGEAKPRSWSPQGVRVIVGNDAYTARRGKAAHEPIVTVRQFNAARRALRARARPAT